MTRGEAGVEIPHPRRRLPVSAGQGTPYRAANMFPLRGLAALAFVLAHAAAEEVSLRIMQGEDTQEHEFPSQVFLLSRIVEPWLNRVSYRTCGGTIISRKWILTAAHCVNSSENTEVSAGSRDRGDTWGWGRPVARRFIVHENYRLYGRNDNNAADDVALVELELPLDGRTLAAAPLASKALRRRTGVVVGWGRTEKENSPRILQKLEVDIIPCPEKTKKVICLRSPPGSGICAGDSGGPLLVDGTVFGVASYIDHPDKTLEPNDQCGDPRLWAVYMRVASYRRWISKHTGI